MMNARRSRQLFYTATTIDGQDRLLLGPFAEKAVAETSVHAASELAYLRFGPTLTEKVMVRPVFVPAGTAPASGELNAMAVSLAGPMLAPA